MLALADVQRQMRDAVVGGDASVAVLLVGGDRPAGRLAIHQRHFEASLTAAVMGRFPASSWLVGANRLEAVARQFVHACPPSAPCIGEYGEGFPAFLAEAAATSHLPYVSSFAALDWHLGRVALCTDGPALGRADLVLVAPEVLAGVTLTLQPGLWYAHTGWPIDDLITLYLTDTAPEAFHIEPQDVRLEVRGSRGAVRFTRLGAGDFSFRSALATGESLEAAALRALTADPGFDPATALGSLLDSGLVVAVPTSPGGVLS